LTSILLSMHVQSSGQLLPVLGYKVLDATRYFFTIKVQMHQRAGGFGSASKLADWWTLERDHPVSLSPPALCDVDERAAQDATVLSACKATREEYLVQEGRNASMNDVIDEAAVASWLSTLLASRGWRQL